jgi:hypothetical protein
MNFPRWPRTRAGLDEGQEVLFAGDCTSVARDRILSLAGGKVHVTPVHLVFTPNVLATLVGHKPWLIRIDEICSIRWETLELRPWPRSFDVLRVFAGNEEGPSSMGSIIMPRSEQLFELEDSINEVRRHQPPQ